MHQFFQIENIIKKGGTHTKGTLELTNVKKSEKEKL